MGVRHSLRNPSAYLDSNIIGFVNILENCRYHHVKHLVYASSSSVYGANTKMPFSEHDSVDHPISLYGATKRANELFAHSYSHLFDVPTTGLRFFTVYGPWGRPDMALFQFTRKILSGEPVEIFNHGKHRRDFTYIDDVVEGLVRVIDQPPQGDKEWKSDWPDPSQSSAPFRLYNIGNNRSVEPIYFIEVLEGCLGKKANKKLLAHQAGDMHDTYADVDDLSKDFDYKPRVLVEKGVKNFVTWYREYYRV